MSLEVIKKATEKISNKVQLMIGRCVLKAAAGQGLLAMQVEALEDEIIEGAERIENYGLAGHPPGGSEGAMVSAGGSRDHVLIVAMEDRGVRPAITEGEVKLYSKFQQFIHLDKDGNIIIDCPQNVKIKCQAVEIDTQNGIGLKGDFTSDSNVKDATSTMSTMRTEYNAHTHGGPGTDTPMN
jgi:phage baseplate assembly protein V